MPFSKWGNHLVAVFRGTTARSVGIAVLILSCLFGAYASGLFNPIQASTPVTNNVERNTIASALYATLVTLPQPVSVSDVAHLLNDLIQNDTRVAGATLVDTHDQLMMQVGAGNDALALGALPVNQGYVPTAKIPVASAGQPFATIVLTFNSNGEGSFTWLIYCVAGIMILMILISAYIELRRYGPLGSPTPR